MSAPVNKGLNIKSIWRFVSHFLIFLLIIHFYPDLKKAIFPDQMTRLEQMLRRSTMNRYHLAIDRKDERKIILTVFSGGQSLTTEIYKGALRELEPSGDSRIFFAHSINDNADGVTYLTRTLIEADPDLNRVRRLEVTVCDRIKDQTGPVKYDGHEPIYACEVPLQQVVCLAAE
jgi:hypothetical protein